MINVFLIGVDEFLGAHVEAVILPSIAKIYHVSNDEVFFSCMHSMIFHGGIDQTSYHMIIQIEASEEFRSYEKELAKYLLEASKAFSVHAHIRFNYYNGNEYSRIEKDYPLFVNKEEEDEPVDEEYEEEDIYLGNMFENFEEQLKSSKNKKN